MRAGPEMDGEKNSAKPGSMGVMTNFSAPCKELKEGWPQVEEPNRSYAGPLPSSCNCGGAIHMCPFFLQSLPRLPVVVIDFPWRSKCWTQPPCEGRISLADSTEFVQENVQHGLATCPKSLTVQFSGFGVFPCDFGLSRSKQFWLFVSCLVTRGTIQPEVLPCPCVTFHSSVAC